jgi:hypothetical protein
MGRDEEDDLVALVTRLFVLEELPEDRNRRKPGQLRNRFAGGIPHQTAEHYSLVIGDAEGSRRLLFVKAFGERVGQRTYQLY